ncbi:MAG: hypothetical protein H7Y03_07735 [Chitinophagaceae bacterium]|nr:hypothetical protein [Chitinophagaceae bacterium]
MLLSKTTGFLAVAGLAAWAYYKYNKMSADEKERMFADLKEKGTKWMDEISPALKSKFGQGTM